MNVLIDTNVMLDFLAQRQPYYEDADKIMQMCKEDKIFGHIAAHSVMNSYFVLRKAYSASQRRDMLIRYMKIVSVVGIDRDRIMDALLREEFTDVEDCLQDECAIACGAEYIVTRNIGDFASSRVKAITPDEFLKMFGF